MREKLQTLPLSELKEMAKSRGIKGISSLRKAEIIDLLCDEAEKNPDIKPAEIKREVKTETSRSQETPRSQEISRSQETPRSQEISRSQETPRSQDQPLSVTSQGARIIRKTGMTAGERITAALFQEGTTASIHRTGPRLPKHMETAV